MFGGAYRILSLFFLLLPTLYLVLDLLKFIHKLSHLRIVFHRRGSTISQAIIEIWHYLRAWGTLLNIPLDGIFGYYWIDFKLF